MSDDLKTAVSEICAKYENDRGRLVDVIWDVQAKLQHVPGVAMDLIAANLGIKRIEVEGVVSFYAFFSEQPKGKIIIRLCNDAIDRFQGADEVGAALSAELGIDFGGTTADGRFSLEHTPCIGLCDQAPACLVNEVMVTKLSGESARKMVRELKEHGDPRRLVRQFGDGKNADDLVQAMVMNNIRERGSVIFGDMEHGAALKNAVSLSPAEVIRAVKTARLRGRGGAGFPAGMKWEFARNAAGEEKVIICNADEGEPGTFKDRVILTEYPDLIFEGMTIAGYAVGAATGLLYLRAEYTYLRRYLEAVLAKRREAGLLGSAIAGKASFSFDIRIQMGAGAYVCGEETALITSCEGGRGDPKNRPPFPAQKGYLGRPTAVNNVETLCCVARILEKGAGWFSQLGNGISTGTKLLSVSGDCTRPGVYELEFGISLAQLLEKAGARNVQAVQVGGAAGVLVDPSQFERKICFEDLATAGAVMIFDQSRDLLEVLESFTHFFIEESCGYCTPCRAGNVLLREALSRIRCGLGEPSDLEYLERLGKSIKTASRCGLGQMAPGALLSALANFRPLFLALVKENSSGLQAHFDLSAALTEAEELVGRASVLHQPGRH